MFRTPYAIVVSAVVILALSMAPGLGGPGATQRPISDFVDQQGTFCFPDGLGGCLLFVPPTGNLVGFDDPDNLLGAAFDYVGLADEWIMDVSGGQISFGTAVSGSITEKPLPDGRAEVHVRLHTTNAPNFVIECEPGPVDPICDFGGAPTIFGNRLFEILDGADVALGSSFMKVKLINTAPGADLPDLVQLLLFPEPGQEIIRMQFIATAEGTLADGTPATLKITQVGLDQNPGQGAVTDGFPVERIRLMPH